MKYTLLLYGDEGRWADDDAGGVGGGHEALGRLLRGAHGRPARTWRARASTPPASATTVRVKDGEAVHTDGPFAETREQLGGFYLLECPDLDAALAWAAKVPDLGDGGCVEVRPVMDYEAAGYEQPGTESTTA